MVTNLEKIKTNILGWLEEYKERTHCKGVVLGLSGGKDSTVVAMLSKKIWGENVFGVLMPNGEQKDISDALAVAQALKIDHRIVNIETVYNSLVHVVENRIVETPAGRDFADNCPKITEKAKTNIPPRLRMTVLYAIAQTLGYRVIGTGNYSESYVGWCTKWGDTACDLNPLAAITCTEVIALGKNLAKEFGLDTKYITKAPSDGLTGKSDEDNFGFTYATLDEYIRTGECKDRAVADKIDQMHEATEHKRHMPYKRYMI